MVVSMAHEICWHCGKRKYNRINLRKGHYVIQPTILISLCNKCRAISTLVEDNIQTYNEF